jgi:hypothetical protein
MPRKQPVHRDLEALGLIVPPPAAPAETGSAAEWKRVERELQLSLPADYKGLIARYGSGGFGDFLYPLNPFVANKHGNLLQRAEVILAAERSSGMWRHHGVPFSLYPDKGGLFPWGVTDNGDTLYWYTHGPADWWPVVAWEGRGFRFEVYQRTASGFLRLWLSGQLAVGVFPGGPFEQVFRPAGA